MRYTDFCSSFIFPFQEKMKGHDTVRWLKFLEQSQWWTAERLKHYADKKRDLLFEEVLKHVPYYQQKNRFDLVTKQDFRKQFNDFKHLKARSCQLQRTGGSTGEPLYFLISNERISHDVAAKWRATRWFNVDIGDKEWVFWGSPIEISSQSIARKIRDFVFRSKLIPARNLDHQMLQDILLNLKRIKPRMLFGYPSILALLASYAERHRIKVNHLGIQVIFVTSEVLDPSQRTLIQEIFGCIVANGYGGRESGFIAHECPQGSMHVTAEDIILEIIQPDGKNCHEGEIGEVVVTHLHTRDFPFIRYRTGDYASLRSSNCLCGRKLPILSHLEGRRSDLIFAQNGSLVHRAEIVAIITKEREIEQFQVIQESLYSMKISIKAELLTISSQKRIIESLKLLLGQEVKVLIEKVDELERDASGKFRFVTSKIAQGMF
ncbi:MAG: AMP-binding protein [Gammaproteobacteria bacterium]